MLSATVCLFCAMLYCHEWIFETYAQSWASLFGCSGRDSKPLCHFRLWPYSDSLISPAENAPASHSSRLPLQFRQGRTREWAKVGTCPGASVCRRASWYCIWFVSVEPIYGYINFVGRNTMSEYLQKFILFWVVFSISFLLYNLIKIKPFRSNKT